MEGFRMGYLKIAEMLDMFRVIPRLLVAGYAYLVYKVVDWYMSFVPYMLEGCVSDTVSDCIVQAPTNQHAALVTAVIGISAAVFGLYTSTGIKWSEYKFTSWKKKADDTNDSA